MRSTMKTAIVSLLAAAVALGCASCNAPTVVQGSVVSFDPASKTLVVKDELAPNAELSISAAKADIGAEPRVGDVVRIAYQNEGSALHATKVMNVTRQEERKKESGH